MINLDQELDKIIETIAERAIIVAHNDTGDMESIHSDKDVVKSKQAIQALITTQKQELLSEIEKELPLPKQTEYMLNKGMVAKTEEDMQRFYRYGGYDFALDQVKSIITTKREELDG